MAIGQWSAFDCTVKNTAGAFNNIISVEMRNDKEKTILAIKLSGLCAFSQIPRDKKFSGTSVP